MAQHRAGKRNVALMSVYRKLTSFFLRSVCVCPCGFCLRNVFCVLFFPSSVSSSSSSSSVCVCGAAQLNVHYVMQPSAICVVCSVPRQSKLRIYFIVRYNDDNIPIKWNWISFVCSPAPFFSSLFSFFFCTRSSTVASATFYKSHELYDTPCTIDHSIRV